MQVTTFYCDMCPERVEEGEATGWGTVLSVEGCEALCPACGKWLSAQAKLRRETAMGQAQDAWIPEPARTQAHAAHAAARRIDTTSKDEPEGPIKTALVTCPDCGHEGAYRVEEHRPCRGQECSSWLFIGPSGALMVSHTGDPRLHFDEPEPVPPGTWIDIEGSLSKMIHIGPPPDDPAAVHGWYVRTPFAAGMRGPYLSPEYATQAALGDATTTQKGE